MHESHNAEGELNLRHWPERSFDHLQRTVTANCSPRATVRLHQSHSARRSVCVSGRSTGKARLDGTSLDLLHQRVDVLCLERMSLGHHFEQDAACATFHSIGNGRRCQLHRRANEQTMTIHTHSGETAHAESDCAVSYVRSRSSGRPESRTVPRAHVSDLWLYGLFWNNSGLM